MAFNICISVEGNTVTASFRTSDAQDEKYTGGDIDYQAILTFVGRPGLKVERQYISDGTTTTFKFNLDTLEPQMPPGDYPIHIMCMASQPYRSHSQPPWGTEGKGEIIFTKHK